MAYKQLTQDQRYRLYHINEMHRPQKEMALILEVSASTVLRELRRNLGKQGRNSQRYRILRPK